MKHRSKQKKQKGQYGYLNEQKTKRLLRTCAALAIVIAVFVSGLLIFHTNATIFSVIAAVGSLPVAKLAVAWLILVKRRTPPAEQYNALKEIVKEEELLSDLILSSTEKTMSIDFLIVHNSKIYGYSTEQKVELKKIEEFLGQYVKREYRYHALKLYSDFDTFRSMVSGCMQEPSEEADSKRDADIRAEILLYCI